MPSTQLVSSWVRASLLGLVLAPGALAGCSSSSAPGGGTTAPGPTPPTEPPAPEPPPAQATCPEGEEIRDFAGKIVVQVSIDGGAPAPWILDTGAPESGMDLAYAKDFRGKTITLKVGGIEKSLQVKYFDDLKADLGGGSFVGIIGQDVFGQVLTVDYPRKRFWIESQMNDAALRACAHVRGTPSTVDLLHEDYIYARGSAEGMPGWFLVDTGASYGATRASVFDALSAAHPRPTLKGFYTPAALGTFWAKVATLGYLETGGFRVEHVFTRTIDDDLLLPPSGAGGEAYLGVLPSGFLHHFMMTVDFPAKKMRLDPARDGELREPTMLYTVGIGLEENLSGPVLVANVLPGSSAAEAGIAPGDEIVSIDGADAQSLKPYSRPFRLCAGQDGAKVTVVVKHAGAEARHELVARDLLTSPAL